MGSLRTRLAFAVAIITAALLTLPTDLRPEATRPARLPRSSAAAAPHTPHDLTTPAAASPPDASSPDALTAPTRASATSLNASSEATPPIRVCPFHTARPNWTTMPYPCPAFAVGLSGATLSTTATCASGARWRACGYPSEEHTFDTPVPEEEECFIARCATRFAVVPRVVRREARVRAIHAAAPARACDRPNVVSYMLDSVSWNHFRRTMRQTWDWVAGAHATQSMEAFAFCEFSAVGVSSWENQGAAYRHKTQSTVFEHFWNGHSVVSVSIAANEWQEQAQVVELGAYPQRPPWVDHNFVISRRYQDPIHYPPMSAHCRGDKFYDELSLQHMAQSLALYRDVPHAVFGYGEAGHHEEQAFLPHIDKALAAALRDWQAAGLLERTVVVLWSDHGHMYSAWSKTSEGKLEHRNPFFVLLVPRQLARCRPEWVAALRENQRRRVTAFDLYATLAHLAGNRSCAGPREGRAGGHSLLCPLPEGRTCAEMGIPGPFCRNPVLLGRRDFGPFAAPVAAVVAELNANLTAAGVGAECEALRYDALVQAYSYGAGLYSVMFSTTTADARRPALWNVYLQDPQGGGRVQYSLLKRQTLYAPDEAACAALRERAVIRMEYCMCRGVQEPETLEALKLKAGRYSLDREVQVRDDLGHRDPQLKSMMVDYWCQFKPWKLKPKDRKHCPAKSGGQRG